MMLFRSIKPATPFKSSIFREEVVRESQAILRDMRDDFERTTRTWNHEVKFVSKLESGATAGGVKISVTTDDDIYRFIDEGTKVRYATMTKHFRAKTEPNVVLSVPGKGGVLFVNKRRPRPGIKARNFSKLIKKTYDKEFRQRVQNALDRAARRFNG